MQTTMPVASSPGRLLVLLLCALSMSVTWRIRGQTGHEFGAALAGALGALALVTLSGRPDWWRRAPSFALFGALGWAFGGSMSYMKVVSFCHSSDSATVLYGFAGLFLIGFLWASLGGGGVALPAVLDSAQLSSLYPAIASVLGAWFVSGLVTSVMEYKLGVSLDWLDSDWLPATTAILGAILCWAVRRRFDLGVSLVLHPALGWWVGILVLVVTLDLHLNPPRGDNWGGIVGVFFGLIAFCLRHHLRDVMTASLATGFLGGFGFCLGQMLKLSYMATGLALRGNKSGGWHAVMEWNQGLFFGAALAAVMLPLILRGPRLEWRSEERRWPHPFA
ncbi:MAG: hypothetical protein NTY38_28690, partial [Acidobacteria bacterium]|nr:hypothetical protein [Acidobacteriota bacterium]